MSLLGKPTESLEDYLEIIFWLIAEKKVARVRDIAKRKNVKMASVTSALKRLANSGFISYTAREFVELTPRGIELARMVVHRHEFLCSFLREILLLDEKTAEHDACTMEHYLSVKTIDRLAAFFQYVVSCPLVDKAFMEQFRSCEAAGFGEKTARVEACQAVNFCQLKDKSARKQTLQLALKKLKPGEKGRVIIVRANSAARQRLTQLGVFPDVNIEMEDACKAGKDVKVKINGYPVSIRSKDANSVVIFPEAA